MTQNQFRDQAYTNLSNLLKELELALKLSTPLTQNQIRKLAKQAQNIFDEVSED